MRFITFGVLPSDVEVVVDVGDSKGREEGVEQLSLVRFYGVG